MVAARRNNPPAKTSTHTSYRSKSYQDARAEQDLRNQLKIEIDPDQPINFENYRHNRMGFWNKTEAKVKSFFEQHPRFTKFVRQHPSTIDTLELAGNLGNLDGVTDILQNPSHAVYYQPQRLGLKAIGYTGAKLVGKFGVFEQSRQNITPLSAAEHEFYSNAKLISSHDIYHAGILDDLTASTFIGGKYKTYQLNNNIILHRAGSNNKPLGEFFSFDKPNSELQVRIDKALLPKWPQGGTSVINTGYSIMIPKGNIVHIGEVGPQGGIYLGGTSQIFVEKSWLIPGVEIINSYPLKEEALWNVIAMTK